MKRKRQWYEEIYWEYVPYFIFKGIMKIIKPVIYILTISFILIYTTQNSVITLKDNDVFASVKEKEAKEKKEAEERENRLIAKRLEEAEKRRKEYEELEIVNRRLAVENETNLSKKICPKGTYLKDKNTGEVGRAKEHQGYRVLTTNDDLYFDIQIESGGARVPDNITFLSYKEYTEIKTKKDNDILEKLTKEEEERLLEIQNEIDAKKVAEIWKVGDYLRYKGELFKVKSIEGSTLYCYQKDSKGSKRFRYMIYGLDREIKRDVCMNEFLGVWNSDGSVAHSSYCELRGK